MFKHYVINPMIFDNFLLYYAKNKRFNFTIIIVLLIHFKCISIKTKFNLLSLILFRNTICLRPELRNITRMFTANWVKTSTQRHCVTQIKDEINCTCDSHKTIGI